MEKDLYHIVIEEDAQREIGTLKPTIKITYINGMSNPSIEKVDSIPKLFRSLAVNQSQNRSSAIELSYKLKGDSSLHTAIETMIDNHNYFVKRIDSLPPKKVESDGPRD